MNRSPEPRSALAIGALLALPALFALTVPSALPAAEVASQRRPAIVQPQPAQARIQLAILLDTSSSMDGLIDQARQQLWSAVNSFAKAEQNGVRPVLEVAVYEYGNSRLSSNDGYTRQVVALTGELDEVSEALFSLTTSGGSEYCGFAIARAVDQLAWSQSQNDVRAIFIAGNEPFSQGPTPYAEAIAAASARGIVVHTIHAGDHQTGVSGGWEHGAKLAGGSYMSIDHNQAIVHVEAPQDREIARLNAELNATYLPFGEAGASGAARQAAQDSLTAEVSPGLLAQRATAKSSAMYDNAGWDLVDALESEPEKLDDIAPASLPAPMREMDSDERRAYVRAKAEERTRLQSRIADLAREREVFVTAAREASAPAGPATLEEALTGSVREQAESKGFSFDKE